MPYQLKYTTRFQALKENGNIYELNISVKDYEGDSQQIILGENPVVQNWQDDDPLKPIKGCVLDINIVNNGTLSLDDFYSDEDDKFLVSLVHIDGIDELDSKELFQGFIIQDDCSEILVDYNHYIQLSATDNLGILKNSTIFDASINAGEEENIFGLSISGSFDGTNNSLIINSTAYEYPFTKILPTSKITITNSAIHYGTYTVLSVEPDATIPQIKIVVKEQIAALAVETGCTLTFNLPVDLSQFLSLRDLVRMCLFQTKLILPLKVVASLKIKDENRWLDDTYIDGSSLNQNGNYINCYDLLESLMIRFNACLFQSTNYMSIVFGNNASWYIVRFVEFPLCQDYTDAKIYSSKYDTNIDFIEYYNENHFIEYDGTKQIETGAIKSFQRPYNYTLEKFNYNFKNNLLLNGDLLTLGNLVFASTNNTVLHYLAEYWQINNDISRPIEEVYIYISNDYSSINGLTENYRFLRIDGTLNSTIAQQEQYLITNRIKIKRGDVLSVSFDYKTNFPNTLSSDYSKTFYHYLETEDNTKYKVNWNKPQTTNGSWDQNGYIILTIPEDTNPINYWQTYQYKTFPAPEDGEFVFSLNILGSDTGNFTTDYRNISILINEIEISKKVIGHTHKTLANNLIKNSLEKDIDFDSSPSYSIFNTLLDNPEHNIATTWDYGMNCEKLFDNVAFYFGSEHPIAGDRVILITYDNVPSGFNINDYPPGTQFTITNSTNGANGTYTVQLIEFITFVPPYTNLYIWTVEAQPFTEAFGSGDFTFTESPKTGSLGELTTFENLFLRWKPRIKIDCNLITLNGSNSNDFILSLISLIKINGFPYLLFLIGSLSIDYKNDIAKCTLYGYINENESIEDLEKVSSYEFKYLYKNS
jgi:hypothetical protein